MSSSRVRTSFPIGATRTPHGPFLRGVTGFWCAGAAVGAIEGRGATALSRSNAGGARATSARGCGRHEKNNDTAFELCDVVIVSQPPGATCQVYGIFTIDRAALASGRPDAPVIKQDFLVNDRSGNPPEITYYTGWTAPGPHRSIEEFCVRFGEPNYGCDRTRGRWRCRDHRYTLEEWSRRDVEPGIRAAIGQAVARARSRVGGRGRP